jgi:DNA-binding PadR family transcriptional regulator
MLYRMPWRKGARLGRLQAGILSILWNKEMYGLEMQRRLRYQGIKASASQLYPTLRKLEEKGAISSREETRVGPNRIYYRLTPEGKELLKRNMIDVVRVFEYMVSDKFIPVLEAATRRLQIGAGSVVVDFSNPRFESIRMELAPLTSPGGRYYITSFDAEHTRILGEWVEYEQLQGSVSVVEERQGSVPLPDASVDYALVFVRLHEEGNDWVLGEIGRLLKPTGQALVVDILAMKGNYREEFYREFMPYHMRSGLDMDLLESLAQASGLRITDRREDRGLVTLTLEHL